MICVLLLMATHFASSGPLPTDSSGVQGCSAPPSARRRTIAVLLDYMTFTAGAYESELREAFHAKSEELGVNLLLIFGSPLAPPGSAPIPQNEVYELVQRGRVEGLIVASTLLSAHCGQERIISFVRRYQGMPLCSLGVVVEGVASIVVDGRAGITRAVDHLIEVHGCRKLAFIGGRPGHSEAEERQDAYRAALEHHGLEWDSQRVAPGHFMREGGRLAMEEIIRRGAEFDGVVAASDAVALGCREALMSSSRVGAADLPVTGFDNWSLARLGPHALTTVAQPFGALAETAIRSVLDQIAGRSVPALQKLPTVFIVRRSCGCGVRQSSKKDALASCVEPGAYLQSNAPRLASAVAALLHEAIPNATAHGARLVGAVQRELEDETGEFVRTIANLLLLPGGDSALHGALQDAIILLRNELAHAATPALENIWFEGLGYLAQVGAEMHARAELRINDGYYALLSTTDRVAVALDVPTLRAAVIKYLPEFGIATAAISRFTDATRSMLEVLVCVRDAESRDVPAAQHSAGVLVPEELFRPGERLTLAIFPLVFEALCLGIAAFEYTAHGNGYQVVRDQISTALRTIGLHQEVVDTTNLHERSMQIRDATAKRMDALSVLAGGVAHDLNNALGPLVALPEIIVAQLERIGVPPLELDALRSDLESIQSASLRAKQTIKDLLTLGRQGAVEKKPCDLNRIAASSVESDALRVVRDASDRVEIVLDLHGQPLYVQGSEPHIARAVTNLVINAIQVVTGFGRVVVKTFDCHFEDRVAAYETISPGDYAAVSVSDTGAGIAPEAFARIFEPFYTGKHLSEHGGTGLGLAVVHGVIKEHAGFVDVTSVPGEGTTFTLYFPRRQLTSWRQTAVPPAPHGRGARVLLVDDDPMQTRTARRVLNHLNYTSSVLGNAQPALDLFTQAKAAGQPSPYDAVVLDMILGEELDGLGLYEKIHELYPGVPAIITSGYAPSARAERAIQQGLRWLPKPYTIDALALALESALAKRTEATSRPLSTRATAHPASAVE